MAQSGPKTETWARMCGKNIRRTVWQQMPTNGNKWQQPVAPSRLQDGPNAGKQGPFPVSDMGPTQSPGRTGDKDFWMFSPLQSFYSTLLVRVVLIAERPEYVSAPTNTSLNKNRAMCKHALMLRFKCDLLGYAKDKL